MNFTCRSHHYYNYNCSSTPCRWRNPILFRRMRRRKCCASAATTFPEGNAGVSARKLAARLWKLRLAAAVSKVPPSGLNMKCQAESCSGLESEIQSCSLNCKHTTEGATKWDPRLSNDVCYFNIRMKLLQDQIATVSVASSIQAQAQLHIHELQAEQRSFQKQIKSLMKMLTSWRRKLLDDLKNELRHASQSMEILNSKLVNELAEAKFSAEKLKNNYEEEKKCRQVMEEVCNELANKIAQDKAKFEESIKMQEEMEEERKMLQIAEVWREERVQMKLMDAKLALEDKYSQMNKLIDELEAFLGSGNAILDEMELRKTELIKQAAKALNIEDTIEFSYMPQKSGDIYSIFNEIQEIERVNHEPRTSSHSPAVNYNSSQNLVDWSNESSEISRYFDEERRERNLVSCSEDQEESDGPGPGPSQSKIAWHSAKECRKTRDENSPNTQMSEICSESVKQSSHKASSIGKLQESGASNSIRCKLTLDTSVSNAKIMFPSRKRKSGKGRRHLNFVGQRSSHDLVNPHVTRGMKGCIEWPQRIQKNSFKAKVLEGRMETQPAQLRSVLKKKTN